MTTDDQHTDLKSLRTVIGETADWESLAKGQRNGARYRLSGAK